MIRPSLVRAALAACALLAAVMGGVAARRASWTPLNTAAAAIAPPRSSLVYVSDEGSGEITVIDGERDEVVATIPVGKRPRALRLSPDGRTLYVALSGSPRGGPGVAESKLPPADRAADGIGEIDVASRKLVRILPSGQDPEAFDLSPDGRRLFISNEETAEASILDVDGSSIAARLPVGREPEGVATQPGGRVVWVTSEREHTVTLLDVSGTPAVAGRIATARRPRGIAFTPDGTRAFVTAEEGGVVTAVDVASRRVLADIQIPVEGARPMGAAVSRDGRSVWVTTGRAGAVAEIDTRSLGVTRVVTGVGERPWGIGVSADGRKLYVANGPSNDVAVIDAVAGRVVKRIPAGALPWGIAVAR